MNTRRNFLKFSGLAGAAGLATACGQNAEVEEVKAGKFDHLPNMMEGIAAITVAEHEARIAKAQELMAQKKTRS